LCIGAEIFYVMHYIAYYNSDPWVGGLQKFCLPGMVMKNIVNLFQLGSAAKMIAEKDAKEFNKKK